MNSIGNILEKSGKKLVDLSQTEIKLLTDQAIDKESIKNNSYLNKIQMVSKSEIEFRDQTNKSLNLKITSDGLNDLLLMMDLSSQVKNKLDKVLEDDKQTISILNHILKTKETPVTLVADNKTSEVKHFIKGYRDHRKFISNYNFLIFIFKMIKENELNITDFLINDIGEITLNTIPEKRREFKTEDLPDDKVYGLNPQLESFYTGLSFQNTVKHAGLILPYTIRLVCTNGMISKSFDDFNVNFDKTLKGNELKVQTYLNELKANNYLSQSFITQMKKASITPASLNEFNTVKDYVLENSLLDTNTINEYFDVNFIEESFKDVYKEIKQSAIYNIDPKQTPIHETVWQLTNRITYLASNADNTKVDQSNRSQLMGYAGAFLNGRGNKKTFDLIPKIETPFESMWK